MLVLTGFRKMAKITKTTDYSRLISTNCSFAQLPSPELEHKFHPTRKWRFDGAWPDQKIAFEVEGGTWGNKCTKCHGKGKLVWVQNLSKPCTVCHGTGVALGRHSRAKGYERDCEKYNEAALLGWCVLRFTSDMVKDGRAMETIYKALKGDS